MTKSNSSSGFSIIEALLTLIVIGILGFTGWYVYHVKQSSNKNYSAAATTTVPTYEKNPYAGWKQYCSSAGSACFKYPSSWTASTINSGDSSIPNSLSVASSSVEVLYNPEVQGVGGTCQPGVCKITTLSITPLTTKGKGAFSIVKSVSTNSQAFFPIYCVTDNSYISELNLKVGTQNEGFTFFGFTSPTSGHKEELCVQQPNSADFNSENDAEAWLASPGVVTAGNILDSITLQ